MAKDDVQEIGAEDVAPLETKEMAYLDDGLYRCDNPNCDLGQGPGTPGFFTGGAFVPDEETNEPVYREGYCGTCHTQGESVSHDNLGIE